MQKVVVIVGTNASGKSGLAVTLAKKYNGEVISADSRQVYRGLDIATGKITPEEMQNVPHHLLDVVEVHTRYSAADFVRDAQDAIADIVARGKLPIIAGGTGFYIDALLYDILPHVQPDDALRLELEQREVSDLFNELLALNPQRAHDLHNKNEHTLKRRIIRAIEVARAGSNKKVSPTPRYDVLWLGILRDKEELVARIEKRTDERLANGMIEEAKRLVERGVSYERLVELGLEYKHLADYMRGDITLHELRERIIVSDRQYAKRQRTWFKKNKHIHWLRPHELPEVAEKLTATFISQRAT